MLGISEILRAFEGLTVSETFNVPRAFKQLETSDRLGAFKGHGASKIVGGLEVTGSLLGFGQASEILRNFEGLKASEILKLLGPFEVSSVFKMLGISEVLGASEILGSFNILRCLLMLESLEVLEPVDAFGLQEMPEAFQLLRLCEMLGASSQEVGVTSSPFLLQAGGLCQALEPLQTAGLHQEVFNPCGKTASIGCQDPSPCS